MTTMTQLRQGDLLVSLKEDQLEPSFKEKTMIDMLYQEYKEEKKEEMKQQKEKKEEKKEDCDFPSEVDYKKIKIKDVKDVLIASGLFLFLNLPFTDEIITKLTKITDPNYRIALKVSLFAVILFSIKHFNL